MNPNDPKTVSGALALLRSLGAPPRLLLHGEIVAEVAGLLSAALSDRGVEHDSKLVIIGAALHDAGKIVHPEELHQHGTEHEAAGEQLLLNHGISPRLSLVCRTHGSWDREAVQFEDLLVAAADHLWKGTRSEALESLLVDEVAKRSGCDRWESFLRLDPIFEQIAAGANERLARANV